MIAFARAAVGAAILLVSAALLAVLASSGGGLAVGASPSLRGAASAVSSTRLLSERIISSEDLLDEKDDDETWPTWRICLVVFQTVWPLLCCLCGLIAYTRSKGHPDELEDDKIIDATNGDRYGPHLELKQRFQAIELCGIEAKNVYTALPDGRIYIRETSDCFQRVCCSVNRELTLWAHGGPSDTAPVFLRMYKPFHLQGCCCCCRPSMEVEMMDGTAIGTIEDPFKCCTMDQQLLDANGELRFTVTGSVCQSGIFCPCLDSVDFDIEDDLGHVVGHISKEALKCKEIFGGTNRFAVDFPVDCTMEDKHLLVGSAMLLDLQYFEQNKSQ